ncbi:MAG: YdcH family protein [Parerythrobacter sp.]
MLSSHISALREKHAKIEERLHREMTRPAPDEAEIRQLKKRKLVLKEEIAAS